MNSYKTIKARHQAEVNAFPLGFAFNEKQFTEMMEKFGLQNDKSGWAQIVSLPAGGFLKKADIPAWEELCKRHKEEMCKMRKSGASGRGPRTVSPALRASLEEIDPRIRGSVEKYLATAGIRGWKDFDRRHLSSFVRALQRQMAASSVHTVCAVLKAFLSRHPDEVNLPDEWKKILRVKNERPMKTYMTAEEVEAFGAVDVDSEAERTVRDGFYVSCKTGLRHSDLVKLLPSNFQKRPDGRYVLNYVSQKTKLQSTIICSRQIKDKVAWLHERGRALSLVHYNDLVRKLAERAGINTEVSVFKAGKELSGPKYKFLSSHSARISFCTILADLGVGVGDIARMAGHSNPSTTYKRYIVNKAVKLPLKAFDFLM